MLKDEEKSKGSMFHPSKLSFHILLSIRVTPVGRIDAASNLHRLMVKGASFLFKLTIVGIISIFYIEIWDDGFNNVL